MSAALPDNGIALFEARYIGLGTVFWAVFAMAMIHQGYTLLRVRPRARMYALISSGVMTLAAASSTAIFASTAWPITSMPAESWTTLGLFAVVIVVFGVAFALLLVDKDAA